MAVCVRCLGQHDWLVVQGIMYEASYATTEAARFFFVGYEVLFTLLFSQLIIGVVVNIFQVVMNLNTSTVSSVQLEYSRAYSFLQQFLDLATSAVLDLNYAPCTVIESFHL